MKCEVVYSCSVELLEVSPLSPFSLLKKVSRVATSNWHHVMRTCTAPGSISISVTPFTKYNTSLIVYNRKNQKSISVFAVIRRSLRALQS